MLRQLPILAAAILRLVKINTRPFDCEIKNIKLVEKKSCKVPGCETVSGTIKIVLRIEPTVDPDRDLVISLQNPCVTHGLSKLVVENWCAIGWLYADVKTKKKICHRRDFFQLSSDLEIPVDNIVDKLVFWCPSCGINKILFADTLEEQERQVDAFVQKECQLRHLNQVAISVGLHETVMDILFQEDASLAINVQKLYIAYRHFGIADLYNSIILILCSNFYEKDYALQSFPTEIIIMICKFAWSSRWESFNKAVSKEFDKYLEK